MDKIAHIHLEGPMIKVAKALLPEKPVALGWYKNHWAFLFNGKPSKKVLQIARKTGFTIHEDNTQTVIALPHVKEYEIKKATQKFDVFAERYKNISKKVALIINRSINEDSLVVKITTTKGEVMASIEKRKVELEKKKKELEKKKKEWYSDINYQIGQMRAYLKKIEDTSFELDMRKPRDPFYKNNVTGDLEHHLNSLKETFKDALTYEDKIVTEERDIEEEEEDIKFEKSNKSASVKWDDYQKMIKNSLK